MPTEVTLSPQANAILTVMQWERKRRKPVTVDEIARRLPISRHAAKEAIGELMEADLIEWEPAAEYRVPATAESEVTVC